MLKLVPSTEPAACAKCSKHFMREVGSDERLCFECDLPPDEVGSGPTLPATSVVEPKPIKCPCGVKESHEGLCSYRVKHLVDGTREKIMDDAVGIVRDLATQGLLTTNEQTDEFRVAVLLVLAHKWSRNVYVLRYLTKYNEYFVVKTNRNFRRSRVFTNTGVNADWTNLDCKEAGIAFLLDVMVGIGDVERVCDGSVNKYKATREVLSTHPR